MAEPRFTFAECFAGIGGFRLGLEALGGVCVFASEYCTFARATYASNWPDTAGTLVGDIRSIVPAQLPPHDLLVGGFPCQSFSNAGRKLGFDDPRGSLFYEIIRLLHHSRPRYETAPTSRPLLKHAPVLRGLSTALQRCAARECAWAPHGPLAARASPYHPGFDWVCSGGQTY